MNQDEWVGKLYREMIRDGIEAADLETEKKRFIEANFQDRPVLFFRPDFMVPALMFCAVFMIFVRVWPQPAPMAGLPAGDFHAAAPAAAFVPPAEPSIDQALSGQVTVERVASDAGMPVVYQRIVNNVPVTVIWVFPRQEFLPIP